MKFHLWPSVVISGLTLACLLPLTGFANTELKANQPQDEKTAAQEANEPSAPSQFQVGSLPPIDVGMAVSGSSHKFMRFDRIADKLQRAGRSIENGEDAQQAERDARINRHSDSVNVDPERAPSEGRANQQGHKAVGVSLQTNF